MCKFIFVAQNVSPILMLCAT